MTPRRRRVPTGALLAGLDLLPGQFGEPPLVLFATASRAAALPRQRSRTSWSCCFSLEWWGCVGGAEAAGEVGDADLHVVSAGFVEEPGGVLPRLGDALAEAADDLLPEPGPELPDEDFGEDQSVGVLGAGVGAVEDCQVGAEPFR